MRIVFMGTPEFALPSLEVVYEEHQLVAVVTQPDRQQGRGQKVSSPPVKRFAEERGVAVYQPRRVSDSGFLPILKELAPEVIVVVAFGQKIPPEILSLPPHGVVNVHASLLPKYRGSSPINRAIIDGERTTGITTMYLNEEWDAGNIIFQEVEPIYDHDTAGTLHDRLAQLGKEVLRKTLRAIERGEAPSIPQDPAQATYAYKLKKEDAKIDWNRPANEVLRLIRGMNPWPKAYTCYRGEAIKVWQAESTDRAAPAFARPGEIFGLTEGGILVACGQGALEITKAQRPNSRVVTGRDLANGLRMQLKEHFDHDTCSGSS